MFKIIVLAENEIIEKNATSLTEAEESASSLSRDYTCTSYVKDSKSKVVRVYERGELD